MIRLVKIISVFIFSATVSCKPATSDDNQTASFDGGDLTANSTSEFDGVWMSRCINQRISIAGYNAESRKSISLISSGRVFTKTISYVQANCENTVSFEKHRISELQYVGSSEFISGATNVTFRSVKTEFVPRLGNIQASWGQGVPNELGNTPDSVETNGEIERDTFKLVNGRLCVGGLEPNTLKENYKVAYPTVLVAHEYCRVRINKNNQIATREPQDFGWSNEVDTIGYDPSLSRTGEFDGAYDRGFDSSGVNAFENKELMNTKFGEFTPIDINKDLGVGNQFVLESNSAP